MPSPKSAVRTHGPSVTPVTRFADLALPEPLLLALQAVGYESPTPIQAQTLPILLEGRDLLGHAPTGTGKTAAFALPVLARIDPTRRSVQALVLTPTRELAIQVAEAFTRYATKLPGLHVLPIYGGQDYSVQRRQLDRGVQVIVGTPGRVMDHLRRGTLTLDDLQTLVLDEADEMLRMGFIDDVEWILEKTPASRQIALFSATMPRPIRQIAHRHLQNPAEISVEGRQATAKAIRQRYWLVSGMDKLSALTRLLEVERFDALLIFVRTRLATAELAERLEARGFAAAALNGDMPQGLREQTVNKLKSGGIDVLVATDVAARGLDVDRISHVINFDIPYDTEAYVHRIGRTGRAGRTGDAILFVTPRERRLLSSIEKATASRIEPLQLPSIEAVNERRVEDFLARITDTLEQGQLGMMQALVERYIEHTGADPIRVAAALARLALGERALLLATRSKTDADGREATTDKKTSEKRHARYNKNVIRDDKPGIDRSGAVQVRPHASGEQRTETKVHTAPAATAATPQNTMTGPGVRVHGPSPDRPGTRRDARADATKTPSGAINRHLGIEMELYRVEVGAEHGVKASHLVGAIANEADLDSGFIGRIEIQSEHSTVELPSGMPKAILQDLKKAWVLNRRLAMSRVGTPRKTGSRETVSGQTGSRETVSRAKPTATGARSKRKPVMTQGKSKRGKATARSGR